MSSTALATVEPTRTSLVSTRRAGGLDEQVYAGWIGTMSESTAKAYTADLAQFTTWLTAGGRTPADVSPGVVTGWLNELSAGRGWGTEAQFREWKTARGVDPADRTPETRARWLAAIAAGAAPGTPLTKASQARKVSTIRSFYRYARSEGATTIDPSPFKTPKPERDDSAGSIDRHQFQAVWAATEGRPRLRALVAVMAFAGLRVAEVVGLQVSDVQEQQGFRVLRVMGKGSKPRTARLSPQAVFAIQQWLQVRGEQDGPLFSTRTGRAMDTRRAHREVRALGEEVGIDGLHPHMFRHTFATEGVDRGIGLQRLQDALGHADPKTTQRYIRGREIIANSPVDDITNGLLGTGGTRRQRPHGPVVTDDLW